MFGLQSIELFNLNYINQVRLITLLVVVVGLLAVDRFPVFTATGGFHYPVLLKLPPFR